MSGERSRCVEFRNSGNDDVRRREREKRILRLVSPLCEPLCVTCPAMNFAQVVKKLVIKFRGMQVCR